MGLAFRIIPLILHSGRRMYKGKKFAKDRPIGVATQAVNIHQRRGVDELMILDVSPNQGIGPDLNHIAQLTEGVFSPVTVGGLVRNSLDVRRALLSGADKVAIGSAWMGRQEIIKECAEIVGSQAIVAIINYADNDEDQQAAAPYRTVDPESCALVAKQLERAGAGEIVLNAVSRDGMMEGFDYRILEDVCRAVKIPVVACGGCGSPEHVLEARRLGASGAAIGSMFAFTDHTPASVAQFLHDNGVEVRGRSCVG